MYNRYVPNAQGSFDRQRAGTPRSEPKPIPPQPSSPATQSAIQSVCRPKEPCKPSMRQKGAVFHLPDRLDTGDLLVLLILLLLLQEGDEDPLPLLITLAAFFLFQ